jgi:hypothetical protein
MFAAVDRKNALPPVADDMIAPVFDAYHEQVAFAFLRKVPIAACSARPEEFVNRDRPPRFLAAEHRLNADLTLQDGPIAVLFARDVEE